MLLDATSSLAAMSPGRPRYTIKKIAAEFALVRKLHHRNVVSTVDLSLGRSPTSDDSWYCVMEYCDAGDLYTIGKLQEGKQEIFTQ